MKKMRKGFTLVELLVVIAVIGILSTMAVIGGSEANNIATANKIVEEFKIIGTAMNMYYADNRSTCDAADATSLAATIKSGLAPYVKSRRYRCCRKIQHHGYYYETVVAVV